MPCGKLREVTANVICPHEVGEIEIPLKVELVQRRRDHSALPRSRAPAHSTLTRLGSAERSRTTPLGTLTRRDVATTYYIEHTRYERLHNQFMIAKTLGATIGVMIPWVSQGTD